MTTPRMTPQQEQDLREAFDNVWAQLTVEQVNELDPGTVHQARHNHFRVNHAEHSTGDVNEA